MNGIQTGELISGDQVMLVEHLTPRELEILSYLADRLSNQEISTKLTLTLSTVKWYVAQICQKLGAENRRMAVLRAKENGILRENVRLRSPDHNLPFSVTPFVGREVELGTIRRLLQEPECRLLTLIGPGGIGKSKLAIQVGFELAKDRASPFPDGVFIIPLAAKSASTSIVPTITRHLKYFLHTQDEPREQLFNHLSQKQLLLILDNYEHLVDDTGSLFPVDLLAVAPGVKILVTSRIRLNVLGEQLFYVEGLNVPETNSAVSEQLTIEQAKKYSGLQLFQFRARQVNPAFKLSHRNLVHVNRICQLTQGMPLAIELAASLVSMLEPAEIAAEILRSSDILVTDAHDIPKRQRSMRSIFINSWELLTPDEQTAVQSLSVFQDGFTREAAEDCVNVPLKTILACVNKGWIQPQESGRFKFHNLLQQYASEILQKDHYRWQRTYDSYSAYYCRFLMDRESGWHNSRQLEVLSAIQADYQNIISAWEWSLEHGYIGQLVQAIESLFSFFDWTGQYHLGKIVFQTALECLEGIAAQPGSDQIATQMLRAKLLNRLSCFTEDSNITKRLYQESLDCLSQLEGLGIDTRQEKAQAFYTQGVNDLFTDPHRARDLINQSLALYKSVGDLAGISKALTNLGMTGWILNESDQALKYAHQGLEIYKRLGDRKGITESLDMQAKTYRNIGHFEEAEKCNRGSLALALELEMHRSAAVFRTNLANTLIWEGKFSEAQALAEESLDDFDNLHSDSPYTLIILARSFLHQRQYTLARFYASKNIELSREINEPLSSSLALLCLGQCALVENNLLEAEECFQESADIARKHEQNLIYRLALADLSYFAIGQKRPGQALQYLYQCLENASRLRIFIPAMQALLAIALLATGQGDFERAIEIYSLSRRVPYLTNSKWFEDIAGQQVYSVKTSVPTEPVNTGQACGYWFELWEAVDRWVATSKTSISTA